MAYRLVLSEFDVFVQEIEQQLSISRFSRVKQSKKRFNLRLARNCSRFVPSAKRPSVFAKGTKRPV
jgi:hypothetical protein